MCVRGPVCSRNDKQSPTRSDYVIYIVGHLHYRTFALSDIWGRATPVHVPPSSSQAGFENVKIELLTALQLHTARLFSNVLCFHHVAGFRPRRLRLGRTHSSPRRNRVGAAPRFLGCHTRQPLTPVLLVSSPHWSIPRAIDYFTIKAQACRNQSRDTSHSNHLVCLLAPCPTLAP